jgi:hypothetical protein
MMHYELSLRAPGFWIVRVIKLIRVMWVGHAAWIEEMKKMFFFFVRNPQEKR